MESEKQFCVGCGIALKQGLFAKLTQQEGYEFEEGMACPECARIAVQQRRGGKKSEDKKQGADSKGSISTDDFFQPIDF